MTTSKFINNIVDPELDSSLSGRFGYNGLDNPLPDSYKVGRDAQLQLGNIERNLFSDIEEKKEGNYVISGLSKQVTELDFSAFSFAVGQILYNQSYQSGNLDTNSGLSQQIATNSTKKVGSLQYNGDIKTSLSNLCRLAYGVETPDTRQKKTMSALVDTLDNTPVIVKFPNGDTIESKLCVTMDKYTRKEDGAVFYNLFLNPIFCSNVKSNFGELPQDIIKRLSLATKKKTTAHYRLLRLLSIQNKNKPVVRTIEELLKELSLYEGYKKERGRAEKQLLSTCDTMKEIGIIERYEVSYTTIRAKKAIAKITFYLSTREKLLRKS